MLSTCEVTRHTKFNRGRASLGFTLIELLITVSIIAVLIAIAIPVFALQLEKSRVATDQANARILNSLSKAYGTSHETLEGDIFEGFATDTARMDALINEGYIDKAPDVQESDKEFAWSVAAQTWLVDGSEYTLGIEDITFGVGWYSTAIFNYIGNEKDIIIPTSVDGITIKQVYQKAFKEKELTDITFADDSMLTRIHAQAFAGNNLTSISLPDTLTRIDYGAFADNPDLNTITIGANVSVIEGNAFKGGDSFKNLYFSQDGGPATYVYENGTWVKI